MSRLHRVWVEPFENAPMLSLEVVLEGAGAGAPPPLLPIERGIPGWLAVSLSPTCVNRLRQGQAIGRATVEGGREGAEGVLVAGMAVRLLDDAGRLIGLGEVDGFGGIRPRRIFNL